MAKAASGKSTHCWSRWFIQKLRFSSSWVVGNSSGGYESIVCELLAYEICPRGGKAFKRALPSENLVRHCCWYSSLPRREETGWGCKFTEYIWQEVWLSDQFQPKHSHTQLKLLVALQWTFFLFPRFVIFRTALDAEMKDATRAWVALKVTRKLVNSCWCCIINI